MRTNRSPDLSVLRAEVAARLGLADARRATPRSSRSAAPTSADLRWPGGVECPRCSESRRLLWLDLPLQVALLRVPLPVQRHRRARSSTARTCRSGSGSSPST